MENDKMKAWQELLADAQVSPIMKTIIRDFFIYYKIDPVKYSINMDATADPYRFLMYEDEPLFSKSLQEFQKRPSLKALGYPDWFYLAFPDVALWALDGLGVEVIRKEFSHFTEEMLIDLNRRQIKEQHLKRVIDLYLLEDNLLECKI